MSSNQHQKGKSNLFLFIIEQNLSNKIDYVYTSIDKNSKKISISNAKFNVKLSMFEEK